MLIEPSAEYVDYIFKSAHYLNCPKHMLNHSLDCLYRQAKGLKNGEEVNWIADYLRRYKVSEPVKKAKEFVSERNKISLQEFNAINVNSYIEKTPAHIEKRSEFLDKWYETHTEYYSGIYGGGVKTVASYPFRK